MLVRGTAGPCPTPVLISLPALFPVFFAVFFGTVQKPLLQALGAILIYFVFDLKSFVGALALLLALLFRLFLKSLRCVFPGNSGTFDFERQYNVFA